MRWIIYLLIFCFAYSLGVEHGKDHAHVEVRTISI
jgi:hypothetical protein